ncbi:hypothetical protein LPB67_11175 [Undibacterium sp. Jales W-56]|uniref:hypothetical protein n=1 Tax=Undibacterium sp. Jales W-56 TaxID=2897325 RepID=UPI0021D29FD6|nr:hypothetical protein [Undibacterium sp. Jales W-56]MCU6434333.1 hypothetical protein [Undibacterium sp. Jales W-56]
MASLRSTRASTAVMRLKDRSNNLPYSLVNTADGRFYLVLTNAAGDNDKLNEPLELDAFVAFVNSIGKQAPKKASKLDIAFEAKLRNKL